MFEATYAVYFAGILVKTEKRNFDSRKQAWDEISRWNQEHIDGRSRYMYVIVV